MQNSSEHYFVIYVITLLCFWEFVFILETSVFDEVKEKFLFYSKFTCFCLPVRDRTLEQKIITKTLAKTRS